MLFLSFSFFLSFFLSFLSFSSFSFFSFFLSPSLPFFPPPSFPPSLSFPLPFLSLFFLNSLPPSFAPTEHQEGADAALAALAVLAVPVARPPHRRRSARRSARGRRRPLRCSRLRSPHTRSITCLQISPSTALRGSQACSCTPPCSRYRTCRPWACSRP